MLKPGETHTHCALNKACLGYQVDVIMINNLCSASSVMWDFRIGHGYCNYPTELSEGVFHSEHHLRNHYVWVHGPLA